ncbi:hypothetical protein B0T10DRAFT_465329 [Thelonectria olida]|uniref:Uncharacterized protein n=1 Tax=Thelonectria olida TaxID=1576542 RepID=A0A9P9AK30_9HYPO|nr:hypothetical protein B0T10DRAFT_465329 [Thelonectria olida]
MFTSASLGPTSVVCRGWAKASEWDNLVGLYLINTNDAYRVLKQLFFNTAHVMAKSDCVPITHIVYRLRGMVMPASVAYSVVELERKLRHIGPQAYSTCAMLIGAALKAGNTIGILFLQYDL